MKIKIAMLFGAILFLWSCSPTPKAVSHKFTTQKHLQAAQHWQILAQDFSTQFAAALQKQILSNQPGTGHAYEGEDNKTAFLSNAQYIFIQTNDVSPFGKAFKTCLISDLTSRGFTITTSPEMAMQLRWGVQKIVHKTNRISAPFPGGATAMAAIGYGVYKVWDKNSSAFPGLIATGATIDLLAQTNGFLFPTKTPTAEILLTMTLSKDSILYGRTTQAYYVNAPDLDHYANIPDYAGQETLITPVKFEVTN